MALSDNPKVRKRQLAAIRLSSRDKQRYNRLSPDDKRLFHKELEDYPGNVKDAFAYAEQAPNYQ